MFVFGNWIKTHPLAKVVIRNRMREATSLSWLHMPLGSAAHGLQQEGHELRANLRRVVNSRPAQAVR